MICTCSASVPGTRYKQTKKIQKGTQKEKKYKYDTQRYEQGLNALLLLFYLVQMYCDQLLVHMIHLQNAHHSNGAQVCHKKAFPF